MGGCPHSEREGRTDYGVIIKIHSRYTRSRAKKGPDSFGQLRGSGTGIIKEIMA